MKKIIILLLLIGINIQMGLANDLGPKWENIAPEGYAEAEYQINDTFYNKHPNVCAFGTAFLIGLPSCEYSANKSANININNYWAKRRVFFQEKKQFCKAIKDNDSRMNCYKDLVQAEHKLSADMVNADATAQAIRAAGAAAASAARKSTTCRSYGNTTYCN